LSKKEQKKGRDSGLLKFPCRSNSLSNSLLLQLPLLGSNQGPHD
jgi:hypothetical protein